MQPYHHPSSELLSSCKTETVFPLSKNFPFLPPSSPWQPHSSSSLYDFDYSRYLRQMDSCSIYDFMISLFYIAQCPQVSSMLHDRILVYFLDLLKKPNWVGLSEEGSLLIMVNFMCQPHWTVWCQEFWSNAILVYLWGCFWVRKTFDSVG